MKQHTFVTPVATAVKKGLALTLFPVALMLTGCSQSQAPANQAEQSVQQQQADYLNTALPLEDRVKALVDSMLKNRLSGDELLVEFMLIVMSDDCRVCSNGKD